MQRWKIILVIGPLLAVVILMQKGFQNISPNASGPGSTISKPVEALKEIQNIDFKSYLLQQDAYKECGDQLDLQVNYFQASLSAPNMAIVQGSSCHTGTAGMDIHQIYLLGESGQPIVIPMPSPPEEHLKNFEGNRNYVFIFEDGRLKQKWHDKWGKHRLVVTYDYTPSGFQITAIEPEPPPSESR